MKGELTTTKQKTRTRKKKTENRLRTTVSGNRVYYLKKSEIKVQKLLEKYEVLNKTNTLEKFLVKKRKRSTQKGKKLIPKIT